MKLIKKSLFLAACAVAVWGVYATTSYYNTENDSLLLSNVEALSADGDNGNNGEDCYDTITECTGKQIFYCAICDWVSNSDNSLFASKKKCSK